MHQALTPLLTGLLVFVALAYVPPGYSQEDDVTRCSLTEFDPKCSPSGWIQFIIGDVTLAVIIGMFIFFLQKRTMNKLAEAIMFTRRVLRQEEEAKHRQVVFVTQSLKNYFSAILMVAGLLNNSLAKATTYDDIPATIRNKHEYMTTMATHANDALNLATHILDPVLTEQIRRFVDTIENTNPESGVGKGFPKYDTIKNDIATITKKLDAVVGSGDEVLK